MTYRPSHAIDIGFAVLAAKTIRLRSGVHWWTTMTPEGAATVAFRSGDGMVRADGWGPGTDWAFTQLPAVLGADDHPDDFVTDHPVISALRDRFGAVRLGATGRWYEALATTAIGQRVVKTDAGASRERLSTQFGETTETGPAPTFPTPETILTLRDHDFHRVGIERSRARVLRVAAKYAARLERLDDLPGAEANEWLQRLPGIGPWTAGWAVGIAGGDPDAVPVGDLHLPRMVTYALTGESNGDDTRMLEALEPFVGHRGRVVRLVKLGDAGPAQHRPQPFRYDISQF